MQVDPKNEETASICLCFLREKTSLDAKGNCLLEDKCLRPGKEEKKSEKKS